MSWLCVANLSLIKYRIAHSIAKLAHNRKDVHVACMLGEHKIREISKNKGAVIHLHILACIFNNSSITV